SGCGSRRAITAASWRSPTRSSTAWWKATAGCAIRCGSCSPTLPTSIPPATRSRSGEMVEVDRYALAMTARMQEAVAQDYERYQFHLVAQRLQAFCSEDLGAFYVDVLKDRLYTCKADSKPRRSAQSALYQITHSLVRLMAPILSFTAEELWQVFTG